MAAPPPSERKVRLSSKLPMNSRKSSTTAKRESGASFLRRHFICGGSIHARNGDTVQPQKHSQLCPVMNEMVHHPFAKYLLARHVDNCLPAPDHLPLLSQSGIVYRAQPGAGSG